MTEDNGDHLLYPQEFGFPLLTVSSSHRQHTQAHQPYRAAVPNLIFCYTPKKFYLCEYPSRKTYHKRYFSNLVITKITNINVYKYLMLHN